MAWQAAWDAAVGSGRVEVTGPRELRDRIKSWLLLSPIRVKNAAAPNRSCIGPAGRRNGVNPCWICWPRAQRSRGTEGPPSTPCRLCEPSLGANLAVRWRYGECPLSGGKRKCAGKVTCFRSAPTAAFYAAAIELQRSTLLAHFSRYIRTVPRRHSSGTPALRRPVK